jgi:hypothetical protein
MARKTLGVISDELHLEREEIRRLNTELEKKKDAYGKKELAALERMNKEGTSKVTGEFATMSISITTVPQINDWNKYYAYITRNKAFHLLERRPAAKAWREAVEERRGKPIPGATGFEKHKLNLRNL